MRLWLKKNERKVLLLQMLLAVVLANLNPVFSKALLINGWSPLQLYFAILLILSGLMLIYQIVDMEHGAKWGMTKHDVFGTVIATVLGGVIAPVVFFEGLNVVGASESIIISSLMPFFVVCFAVFMLKEHFTIQMTIGGIVLMSSLAALLWEDIVNFEINSGVWLILLSAMLSALTAIVHKKYVKHRHIDSIVFVRTLLSLLMVGAWMAITEPQDLSYLTTPMNVWLFLAVPVCCFFIPFFLYFRALPNLNATDTGVLEALGRVIGLMAASAILGEALTVEHLMSISLAVLGIILVSVPLTKWRIAPARLLMAGPLRR